MRIRLDEYDPNWKNIYEDEKNFIADILSDLSPVIEHVGSTAVEGLGAKPIIDVMVGLPDEALLDQAARRFLLPGYIYYRKWESYMPFRRYVVKLSNPLKSDYPAVIDFDQDYPLDNDEKSHHIHIVPVGSEFWERHLLFRDYLRRHPGVREEYFRLKQSLAEHEWPTGNDYAMAKESYIRSVERLAAEEKERASAK